MLAKSTTLLFCLAIPSGLCQGSCIPPYTVANGDTLYSIWQKVGQATSWDTFSTSVCLENNPSYTSGPACLTALGDPNSGLMPIGRQLTFNSVCNSGATNQTVPQNPQAQNAPLIIPAGQSPSPSPVTPAAPIVIPTAQIPSPSTVTPAATPVTPAGQNPSPSPVTPQQSAANSTSPQNPPVLSPSRKVVPTDLCPALYYRGVGTPVNYCADGLTRVGALCYPGSKPMGCPPTREYLRGLCYTPCNATYHEHVSNWCQRNNDDCT